MPGSSKQATHRIKVRSIVLATFLLSSVLALASPNVSRVDAAPKPAPLLVTASITANKSFHGTGPYGNGFCEAGVVDMGPPAGNVDFGWSAINSADQLAWLYTPPWLTAGVGRYDWGVAWGYGGVVCYTRTDSFSFNLSSIPANAIVQSASLTYTNVFTSANQSRSAYVNWGGGNMFVGFTSTLSPSLPGGAFPTANSYTSPSLPVSTVQTWITNRTSGSLWNSIVGDTGNWQIVTQDVALNVTYILDTTPPTTTHALSGTLGNSGYYKSAVALALAAVDTESGVASTKLNGATYSTPLIISTEGTTTHSYYSTDVAGNVEVTKTVSVKIDTVAPATTASLTGLMGLNSWFVGPVSVSLASTDATSGVAGSTLNGSAYTAPVSFSAQGTNNITYFSADNAGNNETTHNTSFKIDTVAPTTTSSLSGTLGTNGWYTSAVTVTLTPTDATSGVGSTVLNGSTYTAPVLFSTQGTNTITYRSTDNAGNSESNQATSFKIDTVAPSASITSHTDNQWVGGVVTLSGNASDATSGAASVSVNIDGAGWNTASGTTSWSTTWNASAFPDASSHTIQVRATDAAGNVGSITSLTLQVDNAPPTAELIVDCPAMGNDNWCRDSVTVRLSGSDAGIGVQSLTYSYNGKTETLNATRASFASGIGGITQVSLYSTDKLNKNSSTQTKEIKIDGAIPTIKFNGGDKSTLNIDVTDGESGLARWTLQVFDSNNNSVYWKESTGEQRGDLSWNGASLLGGTYFVEIFARDNAGLENHLGRTAFMVSLITLPQLFPTATPTIPAPAPRPAVAVVIQATPIPTLMPPAAIAQLPNNPTIQQPNNPITSDSQTFTPKEVTIQIPPALPPNPGTLLEEEVAVPILGMLLGAILAGSFILNADQRTQIALAILVLLLTLTGGASWLMNRSEPQTLDVPLRMQDPDTVFCGPTSLGMAFDFLNRTSATNNQPPATSDLIQFMKSKNLLYDFGTGVEELAYAARLQGYDGSYYFSDWDITRLKQELHEGRPVLTPIKLDNYKQPVGHFLTVTGFSPDEQFVIANDPLKGEVHIPVETFNQAWQANGARGVVVAPKPIPTIPDSTLPLFAGVGAAAALAALAALGTARKGLGAGQVADEKEDSWTNYSAPVEQPVDSWSNYAPFAPDPPDTWFAPPPPVVTEAVDRGARDDAPQSASSSTAPETTDKGERDDAPRSSPATSSPSSPLSSTASSDRPSRYDRQEESQQRPPVIKTVEDAEKKAQADAEAALARFMARHDEALDSYDAAHAYNEEAAKQLQEIQAQGAEGKSKLQEQINGLPILLSTHNISYTNTSEAQLSNLNKIETLVQRYTNIMHEVARYGDDNPRYAKKEKMVAIEIGNLAKEIIQGNSQAALKLLADAASINGEGLTAFLPKALQFSSDQVRAYTTTSFIEGKEVGNSAPLFIYQTMLNRELNRDKTRPVTLALSQYGGSLDVVKDLPEMFTNVKDKSGKTLLKVITEDENAKVVLERLKAQPGGIEALMTRDMYLKYIQAKGKEGKDEWTALNESGAITLIFNPTNPALQDQATALKKKAKEFMNGVELNKSPEAQQALSNYGLRYAQGQAGITGTPNPRDLGLTLKLEDYPKKPSDDEVRQLVDAWGGNRDQKLEFTISPSPTGTGWQVTVKGGTPALFNQSYADAVLLKAGYTLDNPTLFFANDPAKQQLADNLAKGYKYGNITENNVGNSATAKINGVSAYQAELQQWRDGAKDKNEYAEAQRAIDSLILIKGPGVSLITNAENPNLFFK